MNTKEHDFYITLPSNTSADTFPNNTASEYMTKLSRRIQLSGEWEVALHTISYVKWNTIKLSGESIHYVVNGTKKVGSPLKDYYTTVKEYVADVNASIPKEDKEKIVFAIRSGKVTVTLESGYAVHLRKEQVFSRLVIPILLKKLLLRKREVIKPTYTVKQAFTFTAILSNRKMLETKPFHYWILFGMKEKENVKRRTLPKTYTMYLFVQNHLKK